MYFSGSGVCLNLVVCSYVSEGCSNFPSTQCSPLRWVSASALQGRRSYYGEPILPQELYVLAREDDEDGSIGPEDDSPLRDLAGFPLPELGDPGVATNGSEDSGGWETDQGDDGTDEVSCITLALMA